MHWKREDFFSGEADFTDFKIDIKFNSASENLRKAQGCSYKYGAVCHKELTY